MTCPRRSVRTAHRLAARFRPMLDRLEGRALMATAGGLDPTFGTGGTVLQPVKTGAGTGLYNLTQVQVESGGSIVAAGSVGSTATGGTGFGVVRLNANGTPDASFGNDGEADIALPAGMFAYGGPTALLISSTGRIIIVGSMHASGGTTSDGTLVARFNADGSVDTSFGTNGSVVLAPTSAGAAGLALTNAVLEGNGDLLLAGDSSVATSSLPSQQIAAIQLTPSGTLDTTFGTNGLAGFSGLEPGDTTTTYYYDTTYGLALQSNGQAVILAGVTTDSSTDPSHSTLIRLNADGSQDTTLGQASVLAAEDNGSLLIEPNGDFLLGQTGGGLVQLNPDGSLAKTFQIPNLFFEADIALQSNGDIVVFGGSLGSGEGSPTVRVTANLTLDTTFGQGGVVDSPSLKPSSGYAVQFGYGAVGPDNQVVLAGSNSTPLPGPGGGTAPATYLGFAQLNPNATAATPGDFTGDGIADPAVYLTGTATFVIGNSSGGAGQVVQLGSPGQGNSIPAPADYYGTGQQDLAVYLVHQGIYAIKDPTGQTAGLELPFGIAGTGQTVTVPADYYGTGSDQVAVYLTRSATWAILDPSLNPGLTFPFGVAGAGNTIPVPGDYYGNGQSEVAVYLTQTATWDVLNPGLNPGFTVQFGIPGAGNAIPVPGDYDGSGHTELAVYLPSLGELQYISALGSVQTISFGIPGAGQTLPEPGDYTGSGKTEAAAYLPGLNTFAYRPATGSSDVSFLVGFTGDGPIVPVTQVVPSALLMGFEPGATDAIEPPGLRGEADALDFVMPPASDAKKAGETSAH